MFVSRFLAPIRGSTQQIVRRSSHIHQYRYAGGIANKLKELGLREVSTPSGSCSSNVTTPTIDEIRSILKTLPPTNQATLEDKYQRNHTYLRISLSERCNLRCTYCMPEEGIDLTPTASLLTTDELIRLVKLFAEEGVDKVRFTGGEPLVRSDIDDVIRRVNEIGTIKKIAITTNGIVLPRKLEKLQKSGLNHINISLDTLNADKFEQITRRKGFNNVLQSITKAIELGFDPVKINCVMIRNFNESELLDFVEFAKDKLVDVRFIEYMPFDGNSWADTKLVPYQELVRTILERYPSFTRLQDAPNDTAKSYQVPGHVGKISFITSMTEHFCNTCNRIRLTADGNLKVCLFGSAEVSLRDAIRSGFSDGELKQLISYAIQRKKEHHAGMYNIASMKNRPMILIGG